MQKGIKQIFSGDRLAFVLDGLPEGSKIITTGLNVLKDGTEQFIIVVKDGLFTYNANTNTISNKYSFDGRFCYENQTQILQAVNKLYILRGETEYFKDGSAIFTHTPNHLITVSCTSTHGLSVGDEVIIESTNATLAGAFIVNSVPNSTTFTVINLSGSSNVNSHPVLVAKGRPPLFLMAIM